MMHDDFLVWGLFGLLGLGLVIWFALASPEARLRRRRRKSHSRIVSKARHPTVKFSVRPPKDK